MAATRQELITSQTSGPMCGAARHVRCWRAGNAVCDADRDGLPALDLVIVTPLAPLGWWAYGAGGSDGPARTSVAPNGCASWLDVIAVVVVSFNLAVQALFRVGGITNDHTPLNDALGGGGILGLLLLALLNSVLFWPYVAWLTFTLGARLFRRMRAPGAEL